MRGFPSIASDLAAVLLTWEKYPRMRASSREIRRVEKTIALSFVFVTVTFVAVYFFSVMSGQGRK